jgi:hypothetical protein
MAIDPVLQSKLAIWRAKAQEGTITLSEMKDAIICLRMGRKSAVEASAAARKSTSKRAPPSATAVQDALAGLEDL